MFSGIVEEIGVVRKGPPNLVIGAKKVVEGMKIGDSIAVNGACLTVSSLGKESFLVDVMPETIRRTNLGVLRYGDPVNLERAVAMGGRFGGHIVQGHVDGVGKVISVMSEEKAIIMRISVPPGLMSYIVNQGFITVDGVSLTVIEDDEFSFKVSLVAYTYSHTILGYRKPGDMVNLEVDVIAKYVERLQQRNRQGLSLEFLAEHGFSEVR